MVAEEVFSGNASLTKSTNEYDWLGNGIYFWENNPHRALDWAEHLKKHPNPKTKPIEKPAVVGAIIDLGHCLNLLDAKYIRMVKEANKFYENFCTSYGSPIAENKKVTGSDDLLLRYRDCAVIESLHDSRRDQNPSLPPFSSVRGMFTEGKPLYPGAGFHEKSHIQICVRNPNCIKGYFRILEPLDDWPLP